jgi:hypothetical protein
MAYGTSGMHVSMRLRINQGAKYVERLAYLRSQSATVLSALPVARINSLYGLKLRQFTCKQNPQLEVCIRDDRVADLRPFRIERKVSV